MLSARRRFYVSAGFRGLMEEVKARPEREREKEREVLSRILMPSLYFCLSSLLEGRADYDDEDKLRPSTCYLMYDVQLYILLTILSSDMIDVARKS